MPNRATVLVGRQYTGSTAARPGYPSRDKPVKSANEPASHPDCLILPTSYSKNRVENIRHVTRPVRYATLLGVLCRGPVRLGFLIAALNISGMTPTYLTSQNKCLEFFTVDPMQPIEDTDG